LLEPEDFGVFGIALIFTGLAARFGNVGFGHALIQRKEIRDAHISSLFVINLIIFPSIAILLILVSPYIGSFFNSPEAGRVLAVLALVFLTTPLRSVARALMQRRMEFKGPTLATMVDHISASLTSIVFAWFGYGVWSLVYGHLMGSILNTVVLMIGAGWRPRIQYHHDAMKDLFSFGMNIFLKNLLRYCSDKVDFFIVGKQLGPAPLGLYEKAFNLMDITVKELSVKIGPVLFSAFSKIQDDRSRLMAAYHKVIFALSLVIYPVFFGLFLVAPSFIHVLFGEKWMPSVLPLQIMCVAGLMRMHLQVTSTVINSIGKVAPEVWIRAIGFVLLIVGCWYGSLWGIWGIAIAVTVITALLTFTMVIYLSKLIHMVWSDFLRPQIIPMSASGFMFGVVWIYQKWAETALGVYSGSMLFSSVFVGVLSYAGVLWILRPAPVISLIKEFSKDLKPPSRKVVQ